MTGNSTVANGITESAQGDGILFSVKQNKFGNLFSLLKILALVTPFWLADGWFTSTQESQWVLLTAILLVPFLLVMGVLVILTLIVGALTLGRRPWAAFTVGRGGITLGIRQRGKDPDFIPADHIHGLFMDAPQGISTGSRSLVVAGSPGLATALVAGEMASGAAVGFGQLVGSRFAKSAWHVGVKAGGRDIILSNFLSEGQAEYLMHRVQRAFASA